MVDVIGAAASVITLIDTVCTLIRRTRNARDRVKGSSKTLEDVSKQLAALEQSLDLVRDEEVLQTAGVEKQIRSINEVAEELRSFFDQLVAGQQKKTFPQLLHAFKSGDREDEKLRGILDRLDRARDELGVRISVAQVGVVGNVSNGFRVAFDVLQDTNERVHEVLGTHLILLDRLKNRASQPTEADGTIKLDASDAEYLGWTSSQDATKHGNANADADLTEIYDNITLGQVHIMTGDVGIENWRKVAGRKTTIARNQFGDGARIMTGNQGGEAAARFNESFWN